MIGASAAMQNLDDMDLAELVESLGLFADPSDADMLKHELKIRIFELHPDRRAGIDSRFEELLNAYNSLGSGGLSLQLAEKKSELAARKRLDNEMAQALESKSEKTRTDGMKQTSRTFLVPKIGLGAISAAILWLAAFPRLIKDHPLIGWLVASRYALLSWLFLLLFLVVAWVVLWYLEERRKALVARVLSLSEHQRAFRFVGLGDDGPFSASEFQNALYGRSLRYWNWIRVCVKTVAGKSVYFFENPFYDDDLAERATSLALARALGKKWIRKASPPPGEKTLDDWYEFVN
jgi:hypothetical protein